MKVGKLDWTENRLARDVSPTCVCVVEVLGELGKGDENKSLRQWLRNREKTLEAGTYCTLEFGEVVTVEHKQVQVMEIRRESKEDEGGGQDEPSAEG